MNEAALALALTILAGCPDARPIARAIVSAVEARAAAGLRPVTSSPAEDVALLAVYARHESTGTIHPVPLSWDAKAGRSCGVWQMHCYAVRGWSLEAQAGTWLRWVAGSSLAGVDSSPSRARDRAAEARAALRGAL